jgi:hypothetical protein
MIVTTTKMMIDQHEDATTAAAAAATGVMIIKIVMVVVVHQHVVVVAAIVVHVDGNVIPPEEILVLSLTLVKVVVSPIHTEFQDQVDLSIGQTVVVVHVEIPCMIINQEVVVD